VGEMANEIEDELLSKMPKTWLLLRKIYLKKLKEENASRV
jgi:hypothetical protein